MHDVSFLAKNNALPVAAAIGHDMLLQITKWWWSMQALLVGADLKENVTGKSQPAVAATR